MLAENDNRAFNSLMQIMGTAYATDEAASRSDQSARGSCDQSSIQATMSLFSLFFCIQTYKTIVISRETTCREARNMILNGKQSVQNQNLVIIQVDNYEQILYDMLSEAWTWLNGRILDVV
uniref:Uncharacterized protein n=1 Tax=Romanomermis culicivorax TaxID=13658 RepID=A0A915L9F7_ROMCU